MRWRLLRSMAVLGVTLTLLPSTRARAADESATRAAIERSLPFLEQGGVRWMETKKCMSCHTFSFTIWTHHQAKLKGFAVDAAKLDQWVGMARKEAPGKQPRYKLAKAQFDALRTDGVPEPLLAKLKPLEDKTFAAEQEFVDELAKTLTPEEIERHKSQLLKFGARENDPVDVDTFGQLLLGGAAFGARQPDPNWLLALAGSVVVTQQPAGLWAAGGQLPRLKRSHEETNEVTTMWTLLALASRPELGQLAAESRPRALEWLRQANAKPGRSNESLILHLLVQHKFGDPAQSKALLKELCAQQNPDGGWSWVRGNERSDAFATGQSLFALSSLALPELAASLERGRKFLFDTQQADGSWAINPDGLNDAPNADRLSRTAVIWTYWGSAWATIGLLATLPD